MKKGKKQTVKKINPIAKALAGKQFAKKIVKPKKGDGSYKRKPRSPSDSNWR